MDNNSKLLLLYLKTGGGHLAPAKAVADWIAESTQNKSVIELHDGFKGVFPLVRWIVEDGYKHSQAKGKWVFELIYALNKLKLFAHASSWLVSAFVKPTLEKKILAEKPSKIVIFHFFLIKPVLKIIRENNLTIPVLTVVTDPFTAPPIWFLEKNQQFVVFSSQLKQYLERAKKIEPARISVFPFIVNPKFETIAEIDKQLLVRERLGIDSTSKVILLLGGGDGIPRGAKLLNNFAKANIDANIVIVCGNNRTLYNKAQKIKKQHNFKKLVILGYIDFVDELLSLANVVITKCGASTFSEILLKGKIPLVNSYIWEQEKGNVDFIRKNGIGIYEPNPKLAAKLANEVICNTDISSTYSDNLSKLGLCNGTPLVSQYILNY
jgi:processive 1,2-diacylglycerol beta-glucosyltransferase/1,2-diacylglycerol 3-beta-galactosyltransferase